MNQLEKYLADKLLKNFREHGRILYTTGENSDYPVLVPIFLVRYSSWDFKGISECWCLFFMLTVACGV